MTADQLVYVRRHPADWKTAAYRLEDLQDVHFSEITGGVERGLPHSALCAYVLCDGMVDGEVAHSCRHGPPPHRIKVVIPKACNDPKLWTQLAGKEYREPRPLDMSPESVQMRRERSLRATRVKAIKRAALVQSATQQISSRWPSGRIPAAQHIALDLGVPLAVAREARRITAQVRASAKR